MKAIAREARENPELVKGAPYTTPVQRLDEVRAARQPVLRWQGTKSWTDRPGAVRRGRHG
jgi:glycine dehydrogenase subunit 2